MKPIFGLNDLIGEKVLVRGGVTPNEVADDGTVTDVNNDIMVATFLGLDPSCHDMPRISDENGKVWMTGGIIIPYDKKLHKFLLTLSNKEQYDLLANISRTITSLHYPYFARS